MDCSSASEAERVPECGESFQCPKDRKPMFFMARATRTPPSGFPHRNNECPRGVPQGTHPRTREGDSMARISVLGGTGYSGAAVAKEAAGRGHQVTSVSRHE